MFDSDPVHFSDNRVPALYLDYGADAQSCEAGGLEISERGMFFRSRWRFDIGTQLAVACVQQHPELGAQRVVVEGLVVWCETKTSGGFKTFETTLLFLELPDELKQGLKNFTCQLT